jgi:hypothetical protein
MNRIIVLLASIAVAVLTGCQRAPEMETHCTYQVQITPNLLEGPGNTHWITRQTAQEGAENDIRAVLEGFEGSTVHQIIKGKCFEVTVAPRR